MIRLLTHQINKMKQLFAFLLTLTFLHAGAQQKNVFLDPAFWKKNPDVATVKSEIEKGSNPVEFNANSFDGVVLAINAKAPVESIKYLLAQKGNEVSKLTHDGRTYIFWALTAGDPALIEYLLTKGSKLDLEDSHGATPLTFAAGGGQKDTAIYDMLVKHGANLKKAVNHEGANLIHLSVAQDKGLTLTDYFVSKGIDLKATDTAGNTAFNYAARSGNIELLKALVKRGVKYNSNAIFMVGQGGGRGAQVALSANPLEIYQYLDQLGIKPTVTNKNGENLLHLAVRRPNQMQLIHFLLSKGVNINQADHEGNTPFMNAAATNRDTAMIDALLPMVKNINQVNSKGLSALSMATKTNAAPVVKRLIDYGADLKINDANGDNLAYFLMQGYNARNSPEFFTKLKLLQDKGFDITAPQQNGNTLYHLAIIKNDLDLLKSIESLKVDVNSKNKEGLTVLHKAAMTAKDDAILRYLITIGAKKNIQTDLKETVFDLASENEYLAKNKTTIDFLK